MSASERDLKAKLKYVKDRVEKTDLLNEYSWSIRYEDAALAAKYAKKAIQAAEHAKYSRGKAYGMLNLAYVHFLDSENQDALECLSKGLRFFRKHENEKGLPIALNLMGNIYESFGDYATGLEYCQNALKLARENDFREIEGEVLSVIGLIYSRLYDYDRALEHYREGLDIRAETGDDKAMASSLNRIARVYTLNKEYNKALDFYRQSLEIRQREGHLSAIPWTYLGMASTYEEMGDYRMAIEYYEKNLPGNHTDIDRRCRLQCFLGLGRSHLRLKEYREALKFLQDTITMAEDLQAKPLLFEAHHALAELYGFLNEPANALSHFKVFHKVREEVHSSESGNRLKNQQIAFAIEKSEREKEIFQLRNVELKEAFDEIHMKNKAITDSINYASRIQTALLPQKSELEEYLPEHFVLFLPRDIVSGDFFWCTKVDEKIIFTAADCTGHGVPGAFMSMLGIAFLDEIVNKRKTLEAGRILEDLRKEIIKALKQTDSQGGTMDGIDMGLCVFDRENSELQYAGAYNPMYLARNGEITEYKADRIPIGYSYGKDIAFTNHPLQILPGDTVYLFSDGYADQFGGEKGKKLKYKTLQKYILEVQPESMLIQKNILEKKILDWMGNHEQVDDVVIMGVRFQ